MRRDRTSLRGRKNWLHDYYYFFSPEAPEGREQGYQSPATPPPPSPTGDYGFSQSLLICQDTTADTFSAAFVPETCASIFPVKTVSGSLGNSRC